MMTSACITDSLLPLTKYYITLFDYLAALVDLSLTSSIATCLFFAALFDIGYIGKKSICVPLTIYISCVVFYFVAWNFFFLHNV